jgi:hypothetical protein
MALTIWDETERRALLDRFAALDASARPRWGRMDALRMVAHVTDGLRMAMFELPVAPMRSMLGAWPINVLVMFYLPWPKSAPTAPEILARSSHSWTAGVDELAQALARFVARGRDASWAPHPAFGRLDGGQWGRLMRRHLDHHLQQFGA